MYTTFSELPHWRRKGQPTPVFLPGKSHGRRSLVGYSLWGRKELDTTERLHSLHYSTWKIVKLHHMSIYHTKIKTATL